MEARLCYCAYNNNNQGLPFRQSLLCEYIVNQRPSISRLCHCALLQISLLQVCEKWDIDRMVTLHAMVPITFPCLINLDF